MSNEQEFTTTTVYPAGWEEFTMKAMKYMKESGVTREEAQFFYDQGHDMLTSYMYAEKLNAWYVWAEKKIEENKIKANKGL